MKSQLLLLVMALFLITGCARHNDGGGSSGGSPTPSPTPLSARYVYVLSQGDDKISQYALSSDGTLAPLATASVATGLQPMGMVMDAARTHIYVANGVDNTISQLRINDDGSLHELAAAVSTPDMPWSIALSPDGASLYAVSVHSDLIHRYSIGADGALTFASSIASPDGPVQMTFDPSGKYAYVVNSTSHTISQFSVAADGGFHPLSPATVTAMSCPSGPVSSTRASGGGSFVYALSCYDNAVDVFSIGADGTLTGLQTAATGQTPNGMTISGSHLYVANSMDLTVSMFSIQTNGELSLASTASVAGDGPETLAIDTERNRAYVIDYYSGSLLQYSLGSDGALSSLGLAPLDVGVSPLQVLMK